jgi:hydroxypyruvate reductase
LAARDSNKVTTPPEITGKAAARRIFERTLAVVDAGSALARGMARTGDRIRCGDFTADLGRFRRILGIAIGKAAGPMAEALCGILAPDFHAEGIAVPPAALTTPLAGWRVFTGGHPIPNEASFAAGRAILEELARADKNTLVIFLLSGGGSALAECPLDSRISQRDFEQLNRALVTCGAPIEEINIVRRHVSALKGGRMAAAAKAAMKFTYGISDVPAGQESALASGPTLPDPTTVNDAMSVIQRQGLRGEIPESVIALLDGNALPETLKPGDGVFARSAFQLVLTPHDLVHAAHHASESAGYATLCDDSTDGWPLEKAAEHLLKQLANVQTGNPGRKACVISGGEVSSAVTGDGRGGRNSAFVLACVEKIAGAPITVLSAGTDGVDGNSPAAGAVADGETQGRARMAGMSPRDFAQRSDAFTFFERLGDTILTGPTGNNLRDLRILLAE